MALLQEAIAQGYRPMDLGVMTLHDDGDFAGLWRDSEFRALVRPRDGGAVGARPRLDPQWALDWIEIGD